MKLRQILPIGLFALILGPAAIKVLRGPEPPPPVETVLRPVPAPVPAPATAQEWFDAMRPRCTPADVRLATDLNPPPRNVEGTGYKAACLALARQISSSRALLLSLPEGDRVEGAARVYEVAQELAGEGRHDIAGPLMELVLEFWPNHYLALYGAGRARWVTGDMMAAHDFLERFLDVYAGEDDLSANARRMIGGMAER